LIEIADFYNVDVREILEGERRKNMNAPLKDEMVRIADYTKLEQERLSKIMRWMFIAGLAAMAAYLLIEGMEGYAYAKGLLLGGTTGTLLIGLLYTSKYMMRIREFKLKVLKKKRMNESGK